MVFILSALWWIRITGLWKLPDGRDWLRGKLGPVLMGRAMLSKYLIQFSVDRLGCVPSPFFDLRPNYGGGNEDNGDLLPPTLHQATADLCLPCRLLDTQGQVWVSLLWGHWSFLLGPDVHKVLFVPSKSLFSQSCASSGVSTAAAAKSLQPCPTLCDSIDSSPSGSPVPGILQARTLEWVFISFSSAQKWKVKVKLLSHIRLLATPWTAAYQAPPSMRFSKSSSNKLWNFLISMPIALNIHFIVFWKTQ